MSDPEQLRIGDTVRFSSRWLRSVGAPHGWRADAVGKIAEIFRGPGGWVLALVDWGAGSYSEVNGANLVTIERVDREARETENDHVRGTTIGPGHHAFADPFAA